MGRTLQNWDGETHEAVLVALVEHMKPTGSDWSAVVASLRPKGYTFTEGALVYVFRWFSDPLAWFSCSCQSFLFYTLLFLRTYYCSVEILVL
jgi:hypothetical protein